MGLAKRERREITDLQPHFGRHRIFHSGALRSGAVARSQQRQLFRVFAFAQRRAHLIAFFDTEPGQSRTHAQDVLLIEHDAAGATQHRL